MHDDDPATISFNPYHRQNPPSDPWGRTTTNPIQKHRETSRDVEQIRYTNSFNNPGMGNDHDGAESPPLWKTSPSLNPSLNPSPSRPLLSPNSRAEAIVRGQWELMEMVRNMPESSYELSLKDMVEHQNSEIGVAGSSSSGDVINQGLHQKAVVKVRREEPGRRSIDRNLSLENKGLFLNMVFPVSFKSKKKNNNGVKIGAKSEGLKVEKDWWKKKFTGSSDSDSSGISSSSGGAASSSSGGAASSGSSVSGGREKNGFFSGCWPFSNSRCNKSAK